MLTTIRRTLRSLLRSPVYFATSTISLAIGLGLCTSSFLFIDSIRNPHLPYSDPDRLFFPVLRLGNQRTPPSLAELQRSVTLLPAIERVAVSASDRENVGVRGDLVSFMVTRTSNGFFDAIGIRPRLGRLPTDEEARTGTAAVVSETFWHRQFDDAKEIDAARLEIQDRLINIVGVLPRGADLSFTGDIWMAFESAADLESLNQRGGQGGLAAWGSAGLVVKLRAGVKLPAVEAQLAAMAATLTRRFVAPGSSAPAYEFQLRSIRPRASQLGDFEILMLLIGAGVLAIAATNVAALSLARGMTRTRDFALRVALGASRRSIAGEVLAEIGIISAIGAGGGLLMALALTGALTHIVPAELAARWYVVPEFSVRLFAFTAAALVSSVLVAGALPAWRASRVDPADPLKGGSGTTTGRSRHEFRVLVVGELAISMVLLMLASLLSLSVRSRAAFDFGYDAPPLLTANVYIPFTKDTSDGPARVQAQVASLALIRASEGVASAATMSGIAIPDWQMSSEALAPGDAPLTVERAVNISPEFFRTLGVKLLEGRDFEDGDRQQGGAVILSRRAAKVLFPRGGAIGRMVRFGGDHATAWKPVVGIAGDLELYARNPNGREPDPPIYVSMNERRLDGWGIVIRPRRDDPKLAHALLGALRDALPPRASTQVKSWLEDFQAQIRFAMFFAQLFGFIATAAMLLGVAGLFSVLSYAVSRRMREFAVRSALGATQADLVRVVLRYALELSLAGTAIGALLSFWASAGVSGYLWGVKNTDPASLVVAEIILLAVTMAAALVPAYRAARADPVDVLRAA